MKKIYLTSILLILFATTIYAQKPASFIVTKTSEGITVTSMKSSPPFQFKVKGTVVKQLQSRADGVLLKVDGKILNLMISNINDVINKEKIRGEENLLKAHQKWELDYQSKLLFQQPLAVHEEETAFINLSKTQKLRTLFWSFKCPPTKGSNEVLRALQVTKIGDMFVALGSPLNATDSLPERRKLFNEIFASLILPAK